MKKTPVHELTLDLTPRPRWLWAAAAALFLGVPRPAATGENWGRSPSGTPVGDGASDFLPVASGVVNQLTIVGGSAQNTPNTSGIIGYPPSVILGRSGSDGTQSSVNLNPSAGCVGIGGTPNCNPSSPNGNDAAYPIRLQVMGHIRVAHCIWIGSSSRCAGDWQ